jgi:CheY-like chemotaxis protein/REP element-mobilizing transposase RayT
MSTRILVVDANVAFATMIKQALEDLGEYRVTAAGAAPEAIGLAARDPFDLAIVDMGLPDVSGEDTIRGLRATSPRLPVVAIPFNTDSADPMFAALDVQGFLSKPFFLPDLAPIVEEALSRPVGGVAPPRTRATHRPAVPAQAALPPSAASQPRTPLGETPEWLKDAARATRLLTGVARETIAEAVLLIGPTGLVAYAGPFPKEDSDELLKLVSANWAPEKRVRQGALMKYVKLTTSGSDYLLYAVAVTVDTSLAVAYTSDAPVGLVRKQARQAAEKLLQKPPVADPARISSGTPEPTAPPPAPPTLVSSQRTRQAPSTRPLPPETLLDFEPEAALQELPRPAEVDTAVSTPAALPPEVVVDAGLQFPVDPPVPDLVQVSQALYSLTYTLAWAPKYPKTRLTGNITSLLDESIRHLALSFDWRIERVEVRPECVIAIVSCSPATAPEQLVNVLKRSTSELVLAEFPSIAADHPGGDFWAPGYLLLGAGQTLTPQQIKDFLAYTRRGQGLGK